jgi:ribosome biogenesis GTPase
MRSTGSFYDVQVPGGQKYSCRVRGKIRLEGIRETNPVAVGDKVSIELENEIGSIIDILPRENHVLRLSVKKTGHSHVLAANVDQALVVATLAFPRTSLGFIDRFLVSVEAFRVPQLIVFNKRDLLDEEAIRELDKLKGLYESIGVQCFSISALEPEQPLVRAALQGKTTLIAGHSGVGKSTLLNDLSPDIRQPVGAVSNFSSKGVHTTTFTEMFQLNETTFVIDTPGIKEWGLVDMNQQEISDYFPEMRERRLNCKFQSRCIHLNEPRCAIREAVEQGVIAESRYDSYLSMVLGGDNRR